MCDYSLHAVASRPAKVGEKLIISKFSGTVTRGFVSPLEPEVAVCLLPGTELAFAEEVKRERQLLWPKKYNFRVGKFNKVNETASSSHHDAVEFPDGSYALVTLLCVGQQVEVLQLPAKMMPDEKVHHFLPYHEPSLR